MKKLTIVCPAYNEAEGIESFYRALKEELDKLDSYRSDILFVVDGCTDRTFEILKEIAGRDSAVGVIKLSRNFGHQAALLAGIDAATGDAIVTMDSDMQHPPAVIPRMLAEFEAGSDIVYTVRTTSSDVGFFSRSASRMFYWFINLLSDTRVHENASDFRLVSRRVADVLRDRMRERALFLRGIVNWIGYRQSMVRFNAADRATGKTKYSFSRRLQLALSGIVSFSRKPLRAATFVGLLFAVFGFIFAVVTVVQYFLGQIPPSGFSALVVLICMFGGIQLVFLGVVGEYVGAIFDEVKARPHYLIEERVG